MLSVVVVLYIALGTILVVKRIVLKAWGL